MRHARVARWVRVRSTAALAASVPVSLIAAGEAAALGDARQGHSHDP